MPSSTPLDRSRTVGRCASDCPLHSEARGAGRALRRRDTFYRPLLRATLRTYLPALPAQTSPDWFRHSDAVRYLRQVRLGQAHRQLQAADPAAGATVAAIARRWGWASPASFASTYHRQYGQAPSVTLRT